MSLQRAVPRPFEQVHFLLLPCTHFHQEDLLEIEILFRHSVDRKKLCSLIYNYVGPWSIHELCEHLVLSETCPILSQAVSDPVISWIGSPVRYQPTSPESRPRLHRIAFHLFHAHKPNRDADTHQNKLSSLLFTSAFASNIEQEFFILFAQLKSEPIRRCSSGLLPDAVCFGR